MEYPRDIGMFNQAVSVTKGWIKSWLDAQDQVMEIWLESKCPEEFKVKLDLAYGKNLVAWILKLLHMQYWFKKTRGAFCYWASASLLASSGFIAALLGSVTLGSDALKMQNDAVFLVALAAVLVQSFACLVAVKAASGFNKMLEAQELA